MYIFDNDDATCHLSILDAKTLKRMHTIDLQTNISPEYVTVYKNSLYFAIYSNYKNYPKNKKSKLGCYDIKSRELTWEDFEKKKSMYQTVGYEKNLLITHVDPVMQTCKEMTVLDLKNSRRRGIKFNRNISQIAINNEKLYVLDNDVNTTECIIYVYRITDDFKCELIKKEKIFAGNKDSSLWMYVGSMFFK